MLKPKLPPDEEARVQALHKLKILDTPREARFDRITRLASELLGTSIATISLVDRDRQWFKSTHGLAVTETARDTSICGHTILGDEILIIPDAACDERFINNPLVNGNADIRFYAGCPLRSPEGKKIGTLCVIDDKPRQPSESQLKILRDLAALAQDEINQQQLIVLQSELLIAKDQVDRFFTLSQDMLSILTYDGVRIRMNDAWTKILGYEPEELENKRFMDLVHFGDHDSTLQQMQELTQGGGLIRSFENRYICKDGTYKWLIWNAGVDRSRKLIYCLARDNTKRKEMLEDLEKERRRSEKLLLNVLPVPIAERLKSGEKDIANHIASATVLFIDVVGFTKLSNQVPPNELVGLLNELFTEFDLLCERHKLEKIKTIGDAYLAVCGAPTAHENHAQACASAALEVRKVLEKFNERHPSLPVRVRIGMNSGPLVAGVIGKNKFSYDVWGETVNLASRMQTLAEPDTILVSENTQRLLQNQFHFEAKPKAEIKGIGSTASYVLMGKR